jgi:hypothetical protein
MPLGGVVSGANANDGCQTEGLLQSLVVQLPAAEGCGGAVEERSLPRAQADGAYSNRPMQERARRAGFRLQAPKRDAGQSGMGTIRNAVERCHNFSPNLGEYSGVSTGQLVTIWHRSKWLPVSSCSVRVFSHNP